MLLTESHHSSFYAHCAWFTSSQYDDWVSRTSNSSSKQLVVSKADSWFCCRNQTLAIAHLSCTSSSAFLFQRFYSLSYMNETRWVHSSSAKLLPFSNNFQLMHSRSCITVHVYIKGWAELFILLESWSQDCLRCEEDYSSNVCSAFHPPYTAAKHY